MRRLSFCRALAIALWPLAGLSAAQAQPSAQQRAQETVRHAQVRLEQALARAPRLGYIDEAIRNDCAAKNPHVTPDSAFCRCASALTMLIWVSDPSAQMMPRLVDFANGHGNATARSFLVYQGPELYRPLCTLGAS